MSYTGWRRRCLGAGGHLAATRGIPPGTQQTPRTQDGLADRARGAARCVLPWMARGVVTSGYVAYPLSIGRYRARLDDSRGAYPNAAAEALATNTRIRAAPIQNDCPGVAGLAAVPGWASFVERTSFPTMLPTAHGRHRGLAFCVPRQARCASPREQTATVANLSLWVPVAPVLIDAIGLLVFQFSPETKYVRYILCGAVLPPCP